LDLEIDRHSRSIQKSELKTKNRNGQLKNQKQTDTIARYKNRTLNPPIKESDLKTDQSNQYNQLIQKLEFEINRRLYWSIESDDQIGIGRSINRTFCPPPIVCNPVCLQVHAKILYYHVLHNSALCMCMYNNDMTDCYKFLQVPGA
jgi:hypothetical protein